MKTRSLTLAALCLLLVPSLAFAYGPERSYHYEKHSWGSARRGWDSHHEKSWQRDRFEHHDRYNWNRGPQRFNNNPIANGIQSGRLSRDEAQDLRKDAFELHQKERIYLSDGRLTKGERADLRDERQDFYKDLQHQLNDGERRW